MNIKIGVLAMVAVFALAVLFSQSLPLPRR